VTKCDSLGPLIIFHAFAKCCVLRYYYYVGTGYVFFSSTASHDLRIFTIVSIRSPDKEIMFKQSIPMFGVQTEFFYLCFSHLSACADRKMVNLHACMYVGPQIGMSPILVWGLPDLEY
jgi:hypothetical protein